MEQVMIVPEIMLGRESAGQHKRRAEYDEGDR
jgi:hypothetical protein